MESVVAMKLGGRPSCGIIGLVAFFAPLIAHAEQHLRGHQGFAEADAAPAAAVPEPTEANAGAATTSTSSGAPSSRDDDPGDDSPRKYDLKNIGLREDGLSDAEIEAMQTIVDRSDGDVDAATVAYESGCVTAFVGFDVNKDTYVDGNECPCLFESAGDHTALTGQDQEAVTSGHDGGPQGEQRPDSPSSTGVARSATTSHDAEDILGFMPFCVDQMLRLQQGTAADETGGASVEVGVTATGQTRISTSTERGDRVGNVNICKWCPK
ncbi:unnamed protein product [Amoebophrya sp. A120]|nr:unnamed protein product [Amoebophrya sp. A120]|eukprot:GSA120T00009539001.1